MADLRVCADGSAVRTALMAWPRYNTLADLGAVRLAGPDGTDRWTDHSIA